MYEVHYKLTRKPFDLSPDPDFLYLSEKHRRALHLLEYGLLDQAGFIVLTGPAGCGKTTLLRHLLKKKESETGCKTAVVFNTQVGPDEVLETILEAYGLPYRERSGTERLAILREFLRKELAVGNQVVLIIDEAQNLPLDTLEAIRLLSNVDAGDGKRMQIVLVGQSMLRHNLSTPRMCAFAQRVLFDYHISPLSGEEIRRYIDHRLMISGADQRQLFSEEAVARIQEYSKGVPRVINLICHRALVYGFADGLDRLGAEVIEEVVKDWKRDNQLQYSFEDASDGNGLSAGSHAKPPTGETIEEVRAAVDEVQAQQEILFRIAEKLCSHQENGGIPDFLQGKRTVDKPGWKGATNDSEMWLRLRRVLLDRGREVQKYKDRVEELEKEIVSLKERKQ